MKLKRLAAAVLAVTLTLLSAACSAGTTAPSPAAAGGKITIWAWDATFNVKAANMAGERYRALYPDVEVEVVEMAQNDIVAKLNTGFESGNMEGLPNIVLIEDYRIQNYLHTYPGELSDLSDITPTNAFMSYKLSTMTDDGKVYGVPFDGGVACLFYRTDLIAQAGYTAADMEDLTWNEYIEIGKAVKEKTGVAMCSVDPNDLGMIRMMMQSAGKWYVDADGKANIKNNAALREALTIYKRMQDEGITVTATGWDAGVTALNNGEAASAPNGCWYASSIKKAADQSGKWAVAPFPRMSGVPGSVNATNCGGASWYVIDKLAGAEKAKDFLAKTFASDAALLDTLCKEISLVSTFKGAASGANLNAPDAFFGGQRVYRNWADWIQIVPTVNFGMSTYDIESKMTETVQRIMSGVSMDEALDAAQTEVEGIVIAAG